MHTAIDENKPAVTETTEKVAVKVAGSNLAGGIWRGIIFPLPLFYSEKTSKNNFNI